MWYLIQDQTVVHKSETKLRAYIGDYVVSDEDWPVGSSYIDGTFGESVKTYVEELAELNAWKDQQENDLANKMAKVHMRNGAGEGSTIEAMRCRQVG